jgi:hypothetical protein
VDLPGYRADLDGKKGSELGIGDGLPGRLIGGNHLGIRVGQGVENLPAHSWFRGDVARRQAFEARVRVEKRGVDLGGEKRDLRRVHKVDEASENHPVRMCQACIQTFRCACVQTHNQSGTVSIFKPFLPFHQPGL